MKKINFSEKEINELLSYAYNLGNGNDDINKAKRIYLRIIETNPNDNYLVYERLGLLLYKNKELELAITYFKKAVELNPKSFQSLYNIGLCFENLNKYKEAIDYFRKSYNLNKDKDTIAYLAYLYKKTHCDSFANYFFNKINKDYEFYHFLEKEFGVKNENS